MPLMIATRKMKQLTHNQVLHRAYLCSPVWAKKRGEALELYGCVCNRCKEHGTDIHHKTYERWGGNELMEDLEVLCRECHSAHHDAEHKPSRERGIRTIHRRRIYDKLTAKHVDILMNEFKLHGQKLFMVINYGNFEVANRAAGLLGFQGIDGRVFNAPSKIKSPQIVDDEKSSQAFEYHGFAFDTNRNRWKRLENLSELSSCRSVQSSIGAIRSLRNNPEKAT